MDKAEVFRRCKAKTEREHRKISQHTNEVQCWEATAKRWLKLKYLPASGRKYFFCLKPLNLIY